MKGTHTKMKKTLALLLSLTLLLLCGLSLAACNPAKDDSGPIRIGVLAGPTGMGAAKMIADHTKKSDLYEFTVYSSPNDAVADLAAKEIDMVCLPTNTAATLANKQQNYISVIAVNCLGSLYLLSDGNTEINSISDLEGKTITTSVATSTTVPILRYLLEKNHVNAEIKVEADHAALVTKIVKNEVSLAVLPEPMVTTALTKNASYSVDLNLSEEWDRVSDKPLAMGCMVVRQDYLENHKAKVDSFLEEYKSSVAYIGNSENLTSAVQMIVDAGIIPAAPVATSALKNLYGSLVCIDGADMQATLEAFYTVLKDAMPTSIGGKLPDESFYYKK